jgi:hypothetical protein
MWMQSIVAQFNVLWQFVPESAEVSHGKLSEQSVSDTFKETGYICLIV